MRLHRQRYLSAIWFASAIFGPEAAAAIADKPIPVATAGSFVGKRGNEPSKDVSGIACMPVASPGQTTRLCLLVDDEAPGPQFAELDLAKNTLTARAYREVVSKDWLKEAETKGLTPKTGCASEAKYKAELDGEAVALTSSTFFVVGSQACSRQDHELRLGPLVLAKLQAPTAGSPTPAIETTFRLGEAFGDDLAGLWLKPTADGINVEGLAADGDTLYVGLRAPAADVAHIVVVSAASLFDAGKLPITGSARSIALGRGIGIRDMKMFAGDRILILSGPADETDGPYKLQLVSKTSAGAAVDIGEVPNIPKSAKDPTSHASPEGIEVIDGPDAHGKFRVLMVFDDALNGGPQIYEATLPN